MDERAPMRRFGLWFVLVLVCVAVPAALAAPKPLPLTARVIKADEFPPFLALPGSSTTLFKVAAKWVGGDTSISQAQAAARTSRLRREGFVAVLSRQLGTPTQEPYGGLSWVMQLRSAASARTELAANVRDEQTTSKPPKSTYAAFRVNGIPGARGYHLTSPGSAGDNVVFADGPFVYFVGFGWSAKTKNMPTRTQLIAAATRLYERVRGHPPA